MWARTWFAGPPGPYPGANLRRNAMLLRGLIGTVLRRLPRLALEVPYEELRWQVASLRGPKSLPVTF